MNVTVNIDLGRKPLILLSNKYLVTIKYPNEPNAS